ncbi:Nucleoside-diphosphate-sugar epimerase [Micromonospora auratinigra]|uniref:Nucleoside-diphosphate-sugar epimerase n=1 Tax=Micromonospora auratinigra TaxID=261654 RepID=A0A1A8ZIG9_9ACTN|nr:NAD(P)-dependent oxidoreductase [Micromonospora auratinigra]SBT43670.1 Nucleoside-diphosphate-sugar epimerase [Micromonospora auratinigra]
MVRPRLGPAQRDRRPAGRRSGRPHIREGWAPGGSAGHASTAAGRADLGTFLRAHRPTLVVNAAGVVWQSDERRMREVNVAFVRRLVDELGVLAGPPRLVQIGSVHEYGPVPEGTALDEDTPPRPVGPYGTTKLAATRSVLDAADLDAVVLRVANACGPGAPPESLPGMIARHLAAAEPGPLRLAPLLAYRDFVDVRDVAAAVVAAGAAEAGGRLFNIARGETVPVRHVATRLIALSGRHVRIVEEPPPVRARTDAPWQRVLIDRAVRSLGWKPERDLDASLRDLLAAPGQPRHDSEGRQ